LKLSLAIPTPEVQAPIPVALLAGSFAQRLEKAAQLGYDGVELMVLQPEALDVADIRARFSSCGLQPAAIGSGALALVERVTLLAASRAASLAAEKRLHALIVFASNIGAPLVTIGGFRGRLTNPTWTDRCGALAHFIAVLRRAATVAEAADVRLALEPLNRYESDVVNTADDGLALIDGVGHSHLGLLLDTFHMNIEEPSFTGGIEKVMAAGRLWHIHLGDSNRLPPGQGHIPFGDIVASLRKTGYDGYLSAELLQKPDPDGAASATATYMHAILRA
jgi:5-keto-L-gluconate epimerase